MGFGKKGLAAGQAPALVTPASRSARKPNPFTQPAIRPAEPLDPEAARLAAQREAFVAGERNRGDGIGAAEAGTRQSPNALGQTRNAPSFFDRFASRNPSMAMAYLLWFFLAYFSAHRFYLGAHNSALQQMGLMFGSLILGVTVHPGFFVGYLIWGFWVLADLFLIRGLHRKRMAVAGAGFGTSASVFA